MKEKRNVYFLTIFRKYDTENSGKIGKEKVKDVMSEIHALALGQDEVKEPIHMSDLQFE